MKKNIEVVCAVIIKDGKLFSTKRGVCKYDYISHKFEFPGGKIEEEELPEQALQRELKEELNLDVCVREHFVTIEHEYPDFLINLHAYHCEMLSDFVLNEHVSFEWKEINKLNPNEWAPADIPILKKIIIENS